MALEPWRILGELLIFSLYQNPEEVLISVKDCLSSKIDEFTSESEGKEENLPSSMVFYVGSHLLYYQDM